MNDIVIPYLRNSSGELDVCIALIKKNFPHRNIHVLEKYDRTHYHSVSHINQILKLKWAIENLDLTEEFYLFNDDFFVLESVTGTPYYYRGTLDEHVSSRSGGSYTTALRMTRDMLSEGALSYEVHLPFLFNKEKLYETILSLERNISSGRCPLIRSTYGNRYMVGGVLIEDVKNVPDFAGSTYLSTNEKTFRGPIGDYIRSKL